jgi:hypothetical protein
MSLTVLQRVTQMRKLIGLGLSTILALSFTPGANAQADWIQKGLEVFGGGVKVGDSVNFGQLGHEAYWSFCSNNGYRSYYNRDGVFICGYEEYDRYNNQPQGDVYSYDQVYNYYFGNNAAYKWSDATCESQSY